LDVFKFFFPPDDAERAQVNAVKIPCLSNLAACQLALAEWRPAVLSCDRVLYLDSKNLKAFFRRAQAYMQLNEYEFARRDLARAAELDPKNREVKQAQTQLRQRQQSFQAAKVLEEKQVEMESKLEDPASKGDDQ